MGRQVFIITTHQAEPMLERPMGRLAPIGEVLVHVDGRKPIGPFRDLVSSAELITDRTKVFYPSWSLTQASLSLARRAVAIDGAERVTMLRSSQYLIVSDNVLVALADDPRDYIAAFSAPDATRGKPDARFTRRAVRSRNFGGVSHRLRTAVVNRLRPPLHWTTALGGTELRAGLAYWSLTSSTLSGVLDMVDAGGLLIKYFFAINSTDESFFQTVVPSISDHMVATTISFSRWDGNQHPAPLTTAALRGAMDEGSYLFAKKYDTSPGDWVDAELARRSSQR